MTQVFLLKPVSICKLCAELSIKSVNSPISIYPSVLATPSSSPSFLFLTLSGTHGRNSLASLPLFLSGATGSRTFVSCQPSYNAADEPVRCFIHLHSLVVVFFLFLASTLIFFWTRDELSQSNFSILRFPHYPPKNLFFLVMLTVSSLVFTATKTVLCLTLVSLKLAELEILHEAPAVIRLGTFIISFFPVQVRTLRCSLLDYLFSVCNLWFKPWGVSRLLEYYNLQQAAILKRKRWVKTFPKVKKAANMFKQSYFLQGSPGPRGPPGEINLVDLRIIITEIIRELLPGGMHSFVLSRLDEQFCHKKCIELQAKIIFQNMFFNELY